MGNPSYNLTALSRFYLEGRDLSKWLYRLEWTSFMNSGYIMTAELIDADHAVLRELAKKPQVDSYLKKARKEPVEVRFSFAWAGGDKTTSKDGHIAYITDVRGTGGGQESRIIITAIDPPSFMLNAGIASAKVYKGSVGGDEGVIAQVLRDYLGDMEIEVSKTDDNNENKFSMMRMDPKTFIGSLIDWSSSISQDGTKWIVAIKDKKIKIKKESELMDKDMGVYSVATTNTERARDVANWEVFLNNFLTVYQTQLLTGGISSISGRFIDKTMKKAIVNDENTAQKVNTVTKEDRAFKKPLNVSKWPQGNPTTYIMSIPEHNAGDIGIEYPDYIDGRARQTYQNMLNMTMSIVVETLGDEMMNDPESLGLTTCTLQWDDVTDLSPYFLSGNWIIYGFNHYFVSGLWSTKLYLYRLDFDAESRKIGKGKSSAPAKPPAPEESVEPSYMNPL